MQSGLKSSLILLLLGVAFLAIQSLPVAHACQCLGPGPVYYVFQHSDVVFAGTVVSIDWNLSTPITFAVSHVWKGPSAATLRLHTSTSESSCGFTFREGEKYLVYAWWNGQLSTGLCSGTKPLSQAQSDIYWLDHPTAPTAPLNYFLIVLAISALAVMSTSVWLIRRWNFKTSKSVRSYGGTDEALQYSQYS